MIKSIICFFKGHEHSFIRGDATYDKVVCKRCNKTKYIVLVDGKPFGTSDTYFPVSGLRIYG